MKILDRYILFKFLKSFVFTLFVINVIVLVIDYTEKNQKFNKSGVNWAEIGGYYIDYIPWVTNLIIPLICFIASVFVTARLASHTEIVAMTSSGISYLRLTVPYLIGSLIIAGTNFYFTGWVIPKSNKERVAFEVAHLEKPYYFNERNFHIRVSPESYFYVESYSNKTEIGYKVALETIRDHELKEKLTGSRIEWNEETGKWKIKNWQKRTFTESGEENMTFGVEMDTTLNLTPQDFENDYRRYETLTISELQDYMAVLKTRGVDGIEDYRVELQVRYASPFSIIFITIIGMLVAARKSRRGSGRMIGLGFAIALPSGIFVVLSRTLAASGEIDVTLAAWLPNIVFAIMVALLYRALPR